MKNLLLLIICLFTTNINAQITDANCVVDYSQALICGMDEETFAEMETDWYNDKPEITGGMIHGIMDELDSSIKFKKSSPNTIKVTVKSITDKGKFVCDVALLDASNTIIAQSKDIKNTQRLKWGTKLFPMKRGAKSEGEELGSALESELKKAK